MMRTVFLLVMILLMVMSSCNNEENLTYDEPDKKILFLHHSTGYNVYRGSKLDKRFVLNKQNYDVPRLLAEYNEKNGVKYSIERRYFPSGDPYPWKNYPYDYYNIWVKNAGNEPYMEEPTLEMLTPEYDLIVFKFCYPVSNVLDDTVADINSEKKTIANYKMQVNALKEKLKDFPDTEFLVWTGAAQVEANVSQDQAERANQFFHWFKEEWDEEGDNIHIFDFRKLETDGGLYLKPEHASSKTDSHPNSDFSAMAAEKFVDRMTGILSNS